MMLLSSAVAFDLTDTGKTCLFLGMERYGQGLEVPVLTSCIRGTLAARRER